MSDLPPDQQNMERLQILPMSLLRTPVARVTEFRTISASLNDHSFVIQSAPHMLTESTGDDLNHFDPSYFGKGFRWQLADLETSEIAYGLAREYFESHGRRIFDATAGGKLTIFPKRHFESFFLELTPDLVGRER